MTEHPPEHAPGPSTGSVVSSDPALPTLHPGRPARGWVNDPNGLLHHEGRWHVFFQHNPDAAVHGSITWGHVVSEDLLGWVEEPIAIRPRTGQPDAEGCWSGCAVVEDGVPTLVYSGVADLSGASTVLLARSHDHLRTWAQDPDPVVGMPTPAEGPDVAHVRDPFLFELEGRRYAVQGAGTPGGRPSLLVYDAGDLARWRLLGVMLDDSDPAVAAAAPAHVWECPNLVRLSSSELHDPESHEAEDTWLLVVSLWRRVEGRDQLEGVRWLTGDLAVHDGAPRFAPRAHGDLDDGPCFYAPQLLSHGDRVLMWGWAWEHGLDPEQVEAQGWAGTLTFPRELRLVDGQVLSTPATELTGLRRRSLADAEPLPASYEIALGPGPGQLWLDHADDTRDLVVEWAAPATLVAPARLLVDGSLVELFTGGHRSRTTRGYPRPGSTWRLVGAREGGWELGAPADS